MMKTRRKSRKKAPALGLLTVIPLLLAVLLLVKQGNSGNGLTVCIDAGHGGNDPGCVWSERRESEDNLAMSLAVGRALQAKGYRVLLTRSDDTFLSLEERCQVANEREADLFLSFHRNSANGDACGVEVWRSHAASDTAVVMADSIMAALEGAGVQRNRGVQVGSQSDPAQDYYVLRYTAMPSVLVEMGFLDNAEDNRLFDDRLEAYAAAVADGVEATRKSCGLGN